MRRRGRPRERSVGVHRSIPPRVVTGHRPVDVLIVPPPLTRIFTGDRSAPAADAAERGRWTRQLSESDPHRRYEDSQRTRRVGD